MGNFSVIVGVSSRQNTTNLVPFFQLSGKKLLLLETDFAKQKKWSDGIKRVIEARGKQCEIISIGIGNDLAEMETIIVTALGKALANKPDQGIWWIFGGGQKLQQLALFNHFIYRLERKCGDRACYAEPQERTIYIIDQKNHDGRKNLANYKERTKCHLDLNEILSIFGHTSKNGKCLWCRTNPEDREICKKEYLLTSEEENWFDDYDKRQAMFNFMLEKENWEKDNTMPLPVSETIFPIQFSPKTHEKSELGEYFERLMQTRITRIIEATPEQHRINQVWANVHIYSYDGNTEIAEYDLVLVTDFGTIIPMDAKSYDFSKKDEDARLHNLDKLSGVYTNFWAVFPYYPEDLNYESILQKDKLWRKLLRIPFLLKERKSKMLSLSGVGVEAFYVSENKKGKFQITEQPLKSKNRSVKVNTLTTLINTLGLKQ